MVPFAVTLMVFALLHLPGLRKWPGGSTPADKASEALGVALFLPGVLHIIRPAEFIEMIPPVLPWHEGLVYFSGAAEILFAIGLIVPRTRRVAGWACIALFVAVWPANIYTAWTGHDAEVFAQSPLYLWVRVPFQMLYIFWAVWCGRGHIPGVQFRRRMFAKYYDAVQVKYDAYIADRKKRMFQGLQGVVLEIGPGTGANLPYLPKNIRWIGVEPSPYMQTQLRARAEREGIHAEFRQVSANTMEVDDESVDTVISTLVLCSVPDPRVVVEDIRRILKPGGKFVFIEHIAAPEGTRLRKVQQLFRPLWQFIADNCCPDRELDEVIRQSGFHSLEMEVFRVPKSAAIPIVSPHVAGVAVK